MGKQNYKEVDPHPMSDTQLQMLSSAIREGERTMVFAEHVCPHKHCDIFLEMVMANFCTVEAGGTICARVGMTRGDAWGMVVGILDALRADECT